ELNEQFAKDFEEIYKFVDEQVPNNLSEASIHSLSDCSTTTLTTPQPTLIPSLASSRPSSSTSTTPRRSFPGSIVNNAALYKKKTFIYIPLTPPAELIDSTNYTLNFDGRKFVNIGLDPANEFNTTVHIITPSRYVNVSPEFFRRIFALMANLLAFILEHPQKYKRTLFLETNITNYQDLEWSIHETVVRKTYIIRPTVIRQFELIGNYIDGVFTKVETPPKSNEEMTIFIKNLKDEMIGDMRGHLSYVSQLKMLATTQLVDRWAQRWIAEKTPELFVDPISPLSPSSPSIIMTPKKYSSPSPQYTDDNDAQPAPRQSFSPSFFDDECSQINLTQATWAPVNQASNDEDDEPLHFNQRPKQKNKKRFSEIEDETL
ncbi:hypothetical protein AGLY_003317, partial [Aphis glycines]